MVSAATVVGGKLSQTGIFSGKGILQSFVIVWYCLGILINILSVYNRYLVHVRCKSLDVLVCLNPDTRSNVLVYLDKQRLYGFCGRMQEKPAGLSVLAIAGHSASKGCDWC